MGGLVSRSAAHYAEESQYAWRGKLRRLVCLGCGRYVSRERERPGDIAGPFLLLPASELKFEGELILPWNVVRIG